MYALYQSTPCQPHQRQPDASAETNLCRRSSGHLGCASHPRLPSLGKENALRITHFVKLIPLRDKELLFHQRRNGSIRIRAVSRMNIGLWNFILAGSTSRLTRNPARI
jgi:hypothetical protein